MTNKSLGAVDVDLPSAEATEGLGAHLAGIVAQGSVITLRGELGAGKTTLVRGFLRGLGYSGIVKSPTYTLLEPYTVGERQVLHCDLYRMGDPEELEYLGLRDYLDEHNIILIEWPERGGGELPLADLAITLSYKVTARRACLRAISIPGQEVLLRLQY